MIDLVEGLPANVVGFSARGRVTRADYDKVLVPSIEKALRGQPRLRCYYELGPEFAGMDAGAMWEDFKIGIGHLSRWERIAVVTDVDWIRHTVNVFRFLIPGQVRVFPTAESLAARVWITGE